MPSVNSWLSKFNFQNHAKIIHVLCPLKYISVWYISFARMFPTDEQLP